MKAKKIFISMALMSASAFAANSLVWSHDANVNVDPALNPGSWDVIDRDNTSMETDTYGNKVYTLEVSNKEKAEDEAGFLFTWNKGPVSLADYKGVCVTYQSTDSFRVNFVQSTVTDGDYHGFVVPKNEEMGSVFIDFSKLAQQGSGKKVDLNLKSQSSVRFSYTSALARASESEDGKNVITFSEISLGSRCSNNAPEIAEAYIEKTEVSVPESTPSLNIPLKNLFTDADGDALTFTVSMNVKNKCLSLKNTESSFTQKDTLKFVPAKNVDGTANIIITADDGFDKTDFVLKVTVVDELNPPVAVKDVYTVNEDDSLKVTAAKGVLANDTDADGEKLTATVATKPKYGTLTLAKDGSFTYKPSLNFNGDDTWTYTVASSNADEKTATGTVTIHVTPVNDKPTMSIKDSTFLKDTLSLVENFTSDEASTIVVPKTSLVFDDVDGVETLVYGVKNTNISATLKVSEESYAITLAPVKDFKGLANVYLYATDKSKDTVGVKLYVLLTAAPEPPVAEGDVYKGTSDVALSVSVADGVLKNDKRLDVPTATVTAVLDDLPKHGTLSFNENGSFEYLPEAGFTGSDVFTYHAVSDGLSSEVVNVYINIAPTVAPNALVWDNTNPKKLPYKPAYWYHYQNGTGKDTLYTDKTTGDYVFSATVSMSETDESVAGFGFAWKQQTKEDNRNEREDVPISLSQFKGMCLTYSATYPFRVDFKQASIKDYDFYGMELPSKASMGTFFVDFSKIQQEGWGAEVALDLENQLAVQLSYKNTIAVNNGSKNTIRISSVKLGSSCENHAPGIFQPYDVAGSIKLLESDTLKYDLSSMFYDEDGDSLKIYANINPADKYLKLVGENRVFSIFDTLKFVPVPNVSGEVTLTIAATDGIDTETVLYYTATVSVEDQKNPPYAVNDEYETKEDTQLKVSMLEGVVANDYDLDGDKFHPVLVSKPQHGTLTFENSGAFTYKPNANYNGDDTFTYNVVDDKDAKVIGNTATVTIHVLPVNDKPTLAIKDSSFKKDTLKLDEDFIPGDKATIKISRKALVIDDADGFSTLTFGINGKGVDGSVVVDSANYNLKLTPVKDFNGLASLYFFATDSIDTVGVTLYVKLAPVDDPPIGVADVYTGYNDSLLSVSAKEGVLKNDYSPDDSSVVLKATLGEKTAHGEIVFREDGSFDYLPDPGFEGRDAFAYYAVVGETLSDPVMVTINVEHRNYFPVVVVDTATLDTTVDEDFKTILKYSKDMLVSWFKDPEGDPLTYSASSEDGKLNVEVSASGVLTVKSVQDSCGDAYVTVTANDKKSGSTSFKFHVKIKPVNDKPVIVHATPDTAFVGKSGWTASWDLDTLVTDIDGDKLIYTPNLTTTLSKYMNVRIKGSVLTITALDGMNYKENQIFAMGVKCADASTYVTLPIYIKVGSPSALKPVVAGVANGWQNAITAKRGSVSIMDMKGRVMWNAKLPVSAAEVYNASAKVQGRKVLRVNSQSWTIK